MKSILVLFIVPALLISILTFPALAANKPPEKGEEMPVINLPVPKDPEERNYLGLSGSGFFKIPQIKAKAVIIEFFSMYCPICQKDAPGVNELYRLIEKNPDIHSTGGKAGGSSFDPLTRSEANTGFFNPKYGFDLIYSGNILKENRRKSSKGGRYGRRLDCQYL